MKKSKMIRTAIILSLLVFAAAIPLAVTLIHTQNQQQPLIIALFKNLASSNPATIGSAPASKASDIGVHHISAKFYMAHIDESRGGYDDWWFRLYVQDPSPPYYIYFGERHTGVSSGETINITSLGYGWDTSGNTWFRCWAGAHYYDYTRNQYVYYYTCEYQKTVTFPGTEVNVWHYENQTGYEDPPAPGDVLFYFRYYIQNLGPSVNSASVVDRQSNRVWFTCNASDPEGDSIVAYEWQFGDGETSTEVNPSHEYAVAGVYNVGLRVQDYFGTWGEYKKLKVDLLPPTVNIVSPIEGAVLPTNDVTVTWTGSDPGLGVEHYEVSVDGGGWTNVGTSTSNVFPSLSEEFHLVQVRAFDTWGNNATFSVGFTVDVTPPMVEITSPVVDEEFNVSSVTVNWTASDVHLDYFRCRLDSGYWIKITSVTSYTFAHLTNGLHTVEIMAIDEAGNNATDTISFRVSLPVEFDFTPVLVSLSVMQQSSMNPPVYASVTAAIGLGAVVAVALFYIRTRRSG